MDNNNNNNNNFFSRLPEELMEVVLRIDRILNNEDLQQLAEADPDARAVILPHIRRQFVTFDRRTDIDEFVERWLNDNRRRMVTTFSLQGLTARSQRNVPLRNSRRATEVLALFPNLVEIETSHINACHILNTLAFQAQRTFQRINVDWETVRDNEETRNAFYSANFANRRTINNIVHPPVNRVPANRNDRVIITFNVAFRNHIGERSMPLETYLQRFPHL